MAWAREFHCVDAATGNAVWSIDLSDDGPTTAIPYDDVIIFNSESCTIFALDVDTGATRWVHYLGDPMMSAPTVAQGRVVTAYPATPQGKGTAAEPVEESSRQLVDGELRPTYNLACFDAKSGRLLWRRWLDGDCISSPMATGDDVWITSLPGTLYRFDGRDGTIVGAWHARGTSARVLVVQQLTCGPAQTSAAFCGVTLHLKQTA